MGNVSDREREEKRVDRVDNRGKIGEEGKEEEQRWKGWRRRRASVFGAAQSLVKIITEGVSDSAKKGHFSVLTTGWDIDIS